MSSVKRINSCVQTQNKIEFLGDKRIQITHPCFTYKTENEELFLCDAEKSLILDLEKLNVEKKPVYENSIFTEDFYISDDEFNEIINCLKKSGFTFSELFTGLNNYEKLINTIRSPYCSKLGLLWGEESDAFRKLLSNPDCIELFIKAFNLEVNDFTVNLIKNNPMKFCDYAILYLCGFRNSELIKQIIELPKFSAGYAGLVDDYSFMYSEENGFYLEEIGSEDFTCSQSTIFRILLKLYSEEKAAEIIVKMYKSIRPYTSGFADLILSIKLPEKYISYIYEKGFTKELHEILEPLVIKQCKLEVDCLRKAGGFGKFCKDKKIFKE